MASADEQMRVSERVKRKLDPRRREGDHSNGVLEWLLDCATDADSDDGFGIRSSDQTAWIREKR